jgi:urea transport system permease protein
MLKTISMRTRRALTALFALVALVSLGLSSVAFADSLDDAFAKLFADKFSQTEQAIIDITAAAPPHGAEILDALGDGRLYVDPLNKRVIYKTPAGDAFDAKTGAKVDSVEGLKKVRVNNGVRSALEAAIGALSVGAADPQKRIHAAQDLFNNPNPKALGVVDAQLAKERDPGAKAALEQARAAIVASTPDASAADAERAIATLAQRGGEASKNYINAISVKYKDPAIASAAKSAVAAIDRSLFIWGLAQNGWYGISAASVLLLAAIGLAITFGVMGVINMAHGEMVMLGA